MWLELVNSESGGNGNWPCSKLVPKAVLNVDNVESSMMTFTVCHETNTTQVVTASHHAHVTWHTHNQHRVQVTTQSYKCISPQTKHRNLQCHIGACYFLLASSRSIMRRDRWKLNWQHDSTVNQCLSAETNLHRLMPAAIHSKCLFSVTLLVKIEEQN